MCQPEKSPPPTHLCTLGERHSCCRFSLRAALILGHFSGERGKGLTMSAAWAMGIGAAGMACIVTKSTYTGGEDFTEAQLVVDDMGSTGLDKVEALIA